MSAQYEVHSGRARGIAALVAFALASCAHGAAPPETAAREAKAEAHDGHASRPRFEQRETRELVDLVGDAAALVAEEGEGAFEELGREGGRFRQGETYVFVLDLEGNMRVHPDPALEGENTLGLRDVNGRPIIRGLLHAAAGLPGKRAGFYHYEWEVPGGLLPRWKTSYVERVTTPSGETLVVGSGVYDDRMERAFIVDMVDAAARQIEREGARAFPRFHDPKGPFLAKDAYVFVLDREGVDLVNPAFPNLEGRNIRGVRDTEGKLFVEEMLEVVDERGEGWVDYMWPKPGDDTSTRKSAYVRRAEIDGEQVVVGAGVYLADAPRGEPETKHTAEEVMHLVREAASELEARGADAYAELRERGSKWFYDDAYLFVWRMDGTRTMHAADPALEGTDGSVAEDILGRPYGAMFLDAAQCPAGEGWVHYMYPVPDGLFPIWKSTFVKRVEFPSGESYLVGAGVYQMKMDRAFVRDVVERAASLVASEGPAAFDELRDRTGPFYFMDTYVFVLTPEGVELVNPGQPSLEGKNLIDVKDVFGKPVTRANLETAMREGTGWVSYVWYKPGHVEPVPKQTYVKRVEHGGETYVLGAGFYLDEPRKPATSAR